MNYESTLITFPIFKVVGGTHTHTHTHTNTHTKYVNIGFFKREFKRD